MTTDEIIAILQAHKEGKEVESQKKGTTVWEDVNSAEPEFNFSHYNYRIKSHRAFYSSEEAMQAIKEHGDWIQDKAYGHYYKLLYLNNKGGVLTGGTPYSGEYHYKLLYDDFVFADGTPFGKNL